MRIFALETDVNALKEKFLAESEQAAFVTHRHFYAFLVNGFLPAIVSAAVFVMIGFLFVQEVLDLLFTGVALAVWFAASAYFLLNAYVEWKYNFLIVTTQKVVIIKQRSLFSQQISPVPFASISNTRVQSQSGGLFRCGILFINMKIPEMGGQYSELAHPYIPRPDDVSALIEHGLALSKQIPSEAEEKEKKEIMQKPAIDGGNPKPETLPEDRPKTIPKR